MNLFGGGGTPAGPRTQPGSAQLAAGGAVPQLSQNQTSRTKYIEETVQKHYRTWRALDAFVSSDSDDTERMSVILDESLDSLLGVLEVPERSEAKRQQLLSGYLENFGVEGKRVEIQRQAAYLIAEMSDELSLDEEVCYALWLEVSPMSKLRELSERLATSVDSLRADLGFAARQLWYLSLRCGLAVLSMIFRWPLDPRLNETKRRLLFDAGKRLVKRGLADRLATGIRGLASSRWARTGDRGKHAGGLATLAAEALFDAFDEIQITAPELVSLLEACYELSALIDDLEAHRNKSTRILVVTTEPEAPHAWRLKKCRDLLLLAALRSLDPGLAFRDRDAVSNGNSTTTRPGTMNSHFFSLQQQQAATGNEMTTAGGDENNEDDALGPKPRANALLLGPRPENEQLERACQPSPHEGQQNNHSSPVLKGGGARSCAAAALALLEKARGHEAQARDRLRSTLGPGAEFLTTKHGLLTGGMGDGRMNKIYLDVIKNFVEASIVAALETKLLNTTPNGVPTLDGGLEATAVTRMLELVTNACDRQTVDPTGLADRFAVAINVYLASSSNEEHQLFSSASPLRPLAELARWLAEAPVDALAYSAYLGLLASVARRDAARAAVVSRFLTSGQHGTTLGLKELISLLDKYGEALADDQKRLYQLQQSADPTGRPQIASHEFTLSGFSAPPAPVWGGPQTGHNAGAVIQHQERPVDPGDADRLCAIVDLVQALCATPEQIQALCAAAYPAAVGADAVINVAQTLLILYRLKAEIVPLDLKGKCMRALAAIVSELCTNDRELARDMSVLWDEYAILALARLDLDRTPERVVVARDSSRAPPVFVHSPSTTSSSRRLLGSSAYQLYETNDFFLSADELRKSEQNVAPVDALRGDKLRAAAQVVGSSNTSMPRVFASATLGRTQAVLDLEMDETRLGCFDATEGVLCVVKKLIDCDAMRPAARCAVLAFASRNVLLRCAAPTAARRRLFRYEDQRWRLAARALDVLVALLAHYGPDNADWVEDFRHVDGMDSLPSGGGRLALAPPPNTRGIDFSSQASNQYTTSSVAMGNQAQQPQEDFFAPTTSTTNTSSGRATPGGYKNSVTPPPNTQQMASAGFSLLLDTLSVGGGVLRVVNELVADAHLDDEDDDIEPVHLWTKAGHPLTPDASAAANDDALAIARAELDARLIGRGEESSRRGAGVRFWRTQTERLALELVAGVARVDEAFVISCRQAHRSSRAAQAMLRTASGVPSMLAELVTSQTRTQQSTSATTRAPGVGAGTGDVDGAGRHRFALSAVLSDSAYDIAETPFFARPTSGLLLELAKRVAPSPQTDREPVAVLALELLHRVATAQALVPGRLKAILASGGDEALTKSAFAARLHARTDVLMLEADDENEDEETPMDDGALAASSKKRPLAPTPDADGLCALSIGANKRRRIDTSSSATARELTLSLLAESAVPGSESHSLGHWILGLDKETRLLGDDSGCLAALVDAALGSLEALESRVKRLGHIPMGALGARSLLETASVAERALDLLYSLATAQNSRPAVVRRLTEAREGQAFTGLIDSADVLAQAAARACELAPRSRLAALCAAPFARAARAVLELTAAVSHAAALPGVDDNGHARDRARALVLKVVLDLDMNRTGAIAALLGSALEASSAAYDALSKGSADLSTVSQTEPDMLLAELEDDFYEEDDDAEEALEADKQLSQDTLTVPSNQRKILRRLAARRSAAVELAGGVTRLCVVAVGYAYEEALLQPAPAADRPWQQEALAPQRAVLGVAVTALEIMCAEYAAGPDAAALEAATRTAANSTATLRALARSAPAANKALGSEFTELCSKLGSGMLRLASYGYDDTESCRGYIHVSLAHCLGCCALAKDEGGHAVSDQCWRLVCRDASSAAAAWVRMAASSTLTAAASKAAVSLPTFFDDFVRAAGLGSSLIFGSTKSSTVPGDLAAATAECAVAALIRLAGLREGARALADKSVVSALASDERIFAGGRALLLALSLVRQLLSTLPRHVQLQLEAQELLKSRGKLLARGLLDYGRVKRDDLTTMRARTALVGILAAIEKHHLAVRQLDNDIDIVHTESMTQMSSKPEVDEARRRGLVWSLLAKLATDSPYEPCVLLEDAPWSSEEPASWWRGVQPSTPGERIRSNTTSDPPYTKMMIEWSQFDDDKLCASAATMRATADFARIRAARRGRELDVPALVAGLAKARALNEHSSLLCDAKTPAALELKETGRFVLEALLVAIHDALYASDSFSATLKSRFGSGILAAIDDLGAMPQHDDFLARLKRRIISVLNSNDLSSSGAPGATASPRPFSRATNGSVPYRP